MNSGNRLILLHVMCSSGFPPYTHLICRACFAMEEDQHSSEKWIADKLI